MRSTYVDSRRVALDVLRLPSPLAGEGARRADEGAFAASRSHESGLYSTWQGTPCKACVENHAALSQTGRPEIQATFGRPNLRLTKVVTRHGPRRYCERAVDSRRVDVASLVDLLQHGSEGKLSVRLSDMINRSTRYQRAVGLWTSFGKPNLLHMLCGISSHCCSVPRAPNRAIATVGFDGCTSEIACRRLVELVDLRVRDHSECVGSERWAKNCERLRCLFVASACESRALAFPLIRARCLHPFELRPIPLSGMGFGLYKRSVLGWSIVIVSTSERMRCAYGPVK